MSPGDQAARVEVIHDYDAPVARVIAAFQSGAALARWFSPDPAIAVRVPVFAFREGGRFRIDYEMPDGTRPSVAGRYTTIDLPREIAFTWVWQAPDPHAGIETVVRLRFAPQGRGTRLRLTHHRLDTEDMRRRHRAGWAATLARLEGALRTELQPQG